jgi:diguanylate cyclase (GGDEF)-like protein
LFSFFDFDLSSRVTSVLFWIWAGSTLLSATTLGFLVGVAYANRATARGLRKASLTLSSLYALVLDSLENSRKIVSLLENFPKLALTKEQIDQLDSKRGSLLDAVGRIIGTQRESPARQPEPQPPSRPKKKPFKMAWQCSSLDGPTNVPDRVAFDVNLHLMLDATTRADQSSGLLLVRIDRMDQLKSRFGIAGADAFVKELAAILSQSSREHDLVCRMSHDSFAVLFPSVDSESGRKLAQAIRNVVRVHNFRIYEGGPEVLVTASFGFTICPAHDSAESAIGRVGDALAQSMRKGRNQLYVYEGEAVVHCAAN